VVQTDASTQRTVLEALRRGPGTCLLLAGKALRDEGLALMENWLASGDQIDAVASNNDEMAIGAIQAMKAAGIDMAAVSVSGVDATQDALSAMQAGDLDVTVFQNAAGQGAGALDAATILAAGESVDQTVSIPFELVSPSNVADYAAKN
jgi:inositol transport system substrate-binding protein